MLLGESIVEEELKVMLFPPLEGESYSMGAYCRWLKESFSGHVKASVFQPKRLGLPSFLNKPVNKWLLYLAFAGARQGRVNHVIDHGYSHLLLSLDKSSTVVTCHDLHPLELPWLVSWRTRALFRKKIGLMLKAKRVISVSEHTKCDLLRHFPDADAGKVRVVYNGVAASFKRVSKDRANEALSGLGLNIEAEKPIVLHVGLPKAYKNVSTLIEALSLLDENVLFVKVGKLLEVEKRLLERLGLGERAVSLPFVSEEELVALYNAAELFVFPSVHEGFGLPVLEAMACGCPVLCSERVPALEIVGRAALSFDPLNVEQLAGLIRLTLNNPRLRARLSRNGVGLAKRFSWRKTALETEAVYREIVSH